MEMHLFNQDSTTSPFDALKRTDGVNEWWSARELMPLMGYSTWQKFMTPLNRAMQTAGNQGVDVQKNFNQSVKVTTTPGPNLADFELSRYAAYLVAMNGDPNMNSVAAAQSYFAIRTREAEVSQPRELTGSELLAKALVEAHRVIEEAEARAELEAAKVRELTPAANAWAQFLSSTGDVSVNEAAKALSRNSAHVLGERKLRALLEKWGWVYRDHKRRPRAYQSQIDNGRLAERARTYQDQLTGELVQAAPQVRVTAKGLDAARDLLSRMDK